MSHHVFLVPGFFGFANLGEFHYFAHLADEIEKHFERAGEHARVTRVATHPTASLTVRAQRLYECVQRVASDDDDPIHFIGHSSGGLDARLLLSQQVEIEGTEHRERIAERTRTLLTVATPHRGTPLASFFANRLGAPMLRALSIATLHALRFGHVPVRVTLKLAGAFTRLDDLLLSDNSIFEQVFRELLSDFSPDRRAAVEAFFTEVGDEQALVRQLTPEAMELFNAGASDRSDVRVASIVTRARPPGLGAALAVGLDPYQQATRAVYGILYRRAAASAFSPAQLPASQRDALRASWSTLEASDNDGVVPTASQPWGEVLATVEADHLDVIGHFDDPDHKPPHIDWMATGTNFDRERFDNLWANAVRWMLSDVTR